MRHNAPQFPLPLPPVAGTPAPLTLEIQTATQPLAANRQQDLLKATQPPARDLAAWLARLSPGMRANIQARRRGPIGFSQTDPVTGCAFTP